MKYFVAEESLHLLHNELWKSLHLKAMQEKCLQNKRILFMLQRLIGTLSGMSVFTDFFINTILFYIYPSYFMVL